MTFSMQIAVVDQVNLRGRRDAALDRARRRRTGAGRALGRNVGAQLGRFLEDTEYRGEPGLCPMCHLDVIVLRGERRRVRDLRRARHAGGRRRRSPSCGASVITMREKREHFVEIQETAAPTPSGARRSSALAAAYDDFSVARATA